MITKRLFEDSPEQAIDEEKRMVIHESMYLRGINRHSNNAILSFDVNDT